MDEKNWNLGAKNKWLWFCLSTPLSSNLHAWYYSSKKMSHLDGASQKKKPDRLFHGQHERHVQFFQHRPAQSFHCAKCIHNLPLKRRQSDYLLCFENLIHTSRYHKKHLHSYFACSIQILLRRNLVKSMVQDIWRHDFTAMCKLNAEFNIPGLLAKGRLLHQEAFLRTLETERRHPVILCCNNDPGHNQIEPLEIRQHNNK